MTPALRAQVTALLAVLIVAVAGVLSAKHIAPSTALTDPGYQYLMAHGVDASEFCGDLPGDGDHHCPFCRLVSDPPAPAAPECAEILAFVMAWSLFHDQFRPFPRQMRADAARAPPKMA